MRATIYNPKRTQCETMLVEYSRKPHNHIAVAEFECVSGGSVSMTFTDPDALEAHATAMKLLAETLREKQCMTTA